MQLFTWINGHLGLVDTFAEKAKLVQNLRDLAMTVSAPPVPCLGGGGGLTRISVAVSRAGGHRGRKAVECCGGRCGCPPPPH